MAKQIVELYVKNTITAAEDGALEIDVSGYPADTQVQFIIHDQSANAGQVPEVRLQLQSNETNFGGGTTHVHWSEGISGTVAPSDEPDKRLRTATQLQFSPFGRPNKVVRFSIAEVAGTGFSGTYSAFLIYNT